MALAGTVCVAQDLVSIIRGTVTKVGKAAKTVVVKSADGTETTFEYTDTAARDIGKAVGAGTEKGAKVAVY